MLGRGGERSASKMLIFSVILWCLCWTTYAANLPSVRAGETGLDCFSIEAEEQAYLVPHGTNVAPLSTTMAGHWSSKTEEPRLRIRFTPLGGLPYTYKLAGARIGFSRRLPSSCLGLATDALVPAPVSATPAHTFSSGWQLLQQHKVQPQGHTAEFNLLEVVVPREVFTCTAEVERETSRMLFMRAELQISNGTGEPYLASIGTLHHTVSPGDGPNDSCSYVSLIATCHPHACARLEPPAPASAASRLLAAVAAMLPGAIAQIGTSTGQPTIPLRASVIGGNPTPMPMLSTPFATAAALLAAAAVAAASALLALAHRRHRLSSASPSSTASTTAAATTSTTSSSSSPAPALLACSHRGGLPTISLPSSPRTTQQRRRAVTCTGASGSRSPAPLPLSPMAPHPVSPFQSDTSICHAPEWRIATASNSPAVTPRTSYNGITGGNLLGASPGHPLLYQALPSAATTASHAGTAVPGKPPRAATGSVQDPSCFGPRRDSSRSMEQPPRLSLPGHIFLLDTAAPQLPWPTSHGSLASTATAAAEGVTSVGTSFCISESCSSSNRSSRCSSKSEEQEEGTYLIIDSCSVTPCSEPRVHTPFARESPFTTDFKFAPAPALRPPLSPGIHTQSQQRQHHMQQQQPRGAYNRQESMPLPYRASWCGPQGPPSYDTRHMAPSVGAGWDSGAAHGRASAGHVGPGRAVTPQVLQAVHEHVGVVAGVVVPAGAGRTPGPLQRCSSAVGAPGQAGSGEPGQRMACQRQPGGHGGQQEQQLLLQRTGKGQGRGLLPMVLPPPVLATGLGAGLRGMRSAAL